jgi:hypothetical protein
MKMRATNIPENIRIKLSEFLTEYRAMEAFWGSGSRAPRILGLGTRWR